jgi:hypothetical protein
MGMEVGASRSWAFSLLEHVDVQKTQLSLMKRSKFTFIHSFRTTYTTYEVTTTNTQCDYQLS